jgi:hypothetical protein
MTFVAITSLVRTAEPVSATCKNCAGQGTGIVVISHVRNHGILNHQYKIGIGQPPSLPATRKNGNSKHIQGVAMLKAGKRGIRIVNKTERRQYLGPTFCPGVFAAVERLYASAPESSRGEVYLLVAVPCAVFGTRREALEWPRAVLSRLIPPAQGLAE